MTAERDAMTLKEVFLPALGVEERSDEAPRAGRARPGPDPEVVAKPKRRQFSAQYRLRILEEVERCTRRGEVGRLLRREGLYSSHLTAWRKARRKGSLRELASKKRGVKPAERNPLDAKVRALEHEAHTWLVWSTSCTPQCGRHTILDVQGKVAGLLDEPQTARGIEPRTRAALLMAAQPLAGVSDRSQGSRTNGTPISRTLSIRGEQVAKTPTREAVTQY